MLRLDRQPLRLGLAEAVPVPRSSQQIHPELATKRFLDHLAVTPPGPSGTDPNGAQDLFVDRERGSYLCHLRIIAS